jgi:hypothetical protein
MNSVTVQDLIDCLQTLGPANLIGLALLNEFPLAPGGWFPDQVPEERLIAATIQIIQYGDDCRRMTGRLTALRAVPVSLPVVEYGL